MDDKTLMESLLMTLKGVCDLYMHGSIESNTDQVRNTFDQALQDSLNMQSEIYKVMSQKGWYPTTQASTNQINQVKQKFAQA